MRRFQLGGKVYEVAALDDISLRDMLQFELETEAMGRRMTWTDVQEIHARLDALPDDDARSQDSGALWLMAAAIWATRRASGEQVTFEQAVNFPMRDLKILTDTTDHKAGSPKGRRQTAGGQGARSRRSSSATTSPSGSQPTSDEASTSG